MALPLEGVRVLDLTSVMAGPYCSMLLGDMGADVIKIESFPDGDTSRAFVPQIRGESYCFTVLNRNKRSLAIDMKSAKGRNIVHQLAKRADIITENFRPGVVKKLGLDYETLRQHNSGLVYASMSGFGQTGPYAGRGGYDIIAQGMSGIMMMTGEPGGRPAKVGIAMNDIASGVTALYAILGAYISRLRSGQGQYVETSLLEAGLAWSQWEFGAFFGAGELPAAMGTRHRRAAPYQAYRTSDGYVTVGANNEKLWRAFCEQVCASPHWLSDPRYASNALRVQHADALQADIEAVFTSHPTAHWVEALDAAAVPGGPVYSYQQVFDDPHVKARAMVVEMEHPIMGTIKTFGSPVKSSGELVSIRRAAPWLGQHSEEILRSLGIAEDEIKSLFDEAIIFDRQRV
ncbi:MAG: CaiB/BaiF CoA transferase family protein [Burkholderiaceae bacterium]|jgi:crotonobetainyl-CoA:carnitine CoA-transferase CaiB-like acyl-CoA transferase